MMNELYGSHQLYQFGEIKYYGINTVYRNIYGIKKKHQKIE